MPTTTLRMMNRRQCATKSSSSTLNEGVSNNGTDYGQLKGNNAIGIRREDKNRWERRTPLTPTHVEALVKQGVSVFVQPSTLRIFPDAEYSRAGAHVQEDLTPASVILAVKEVPIHKLIPKRTYCFFSHTIKAQEYNMPLLDAILENHIRLIDYERIVDATGKRLVRFGHYAGYAGMIDFFHCLGNRLLAMGYSSPFLHVGYTHMYVDLDYARAAVTAIGKEIEQAGLPRALGPLVFTFTGSGSVSRGARDIFELLPHRWVHPRDLPALVESKSFDNHVVYGVMATSDNIVRLRDPEQHDKPLDKAHYYANPELYESTFAQTIAPYTSVLVNCLYWDQRYPRLLTSQQAEHLARSRRSRLIGLADLSADRGGSVEFMQRLTTIDHPYYVYDVERQVASDDIASERGVLILSVDNLPTEIPFEASKYFGDSLLPFIKNLAASDGSLPFADQTDLAPELRTAVITSQGELTPAYKYIADFRRRNERERLSVSAKQKVLVLGSGMVAPPLVHHLSRFNGLHVTVASNDIESAERIAKGRRRTVATELDVADKSELRNLIRSHDVVVSLLPPSMHVDIARICVAERRHLVTTSYVSDAMAALHNDARTAGVTILNEVGLDPGIDHLLAMRVINEATQRGGKLVSFISHCGGLPAPECSGNPFGYKFSWSPRGALAAGLNGARFKLNGQHVELAPGTIFQHATPTVFLPGYRCEVLANRDSLKYAELYGVGDAHTFVRGTLRFQGWSVVLDALTRLGLLSDKPSALFAPGAAKMSWRKVVATMLPDFAGYDVEGAVLRHLGLAVTGKEEQARAVETAMTWLGLFSNTVTVAQKGTCIDSLCDLMLSKMSYADGERDLVLLKHLFVIQESDGRETKHSSMLIAYGDERTSAMAKLVGVPAAVATKLILDEHIIRRGVLAPVTPDIYYPMLQQLQQAGIKSVEQQE
jgi:alpha-aminoadipic semialdehyde synthase